MDPRVARTRASLQESLLALARERPLDEIAVGDITQRAGINRSTFYQHYDDKDQLLAAAFEGAISWASAGAPHPGHGDIEGTPPEMRQYLQHIKDNATVYRQVLSTRGFSTIAEALRRRIEDLITDAIDGHTTLETNGLPADVVAAALSGMAIGIISAWLRHDPLPDVSLAAQWLWTALTHPAIAP